MKGKELDTFNNTYADNVSVSDSEFTEQKVIKQADADRCVSNLLYFTFFKSKNDFALWKDLSKKTILPRCSTENISF